VHFFNTHIRPEKFPMDFVIFNGEVTKYEMLEERGDQWKRLEKENRLQELEVKKPSSLMWDLFFRVFGFAAVVIGVSLVVGMIYAMLAH
jgi:ABC-type sugar transport system permease subunit